MKLVLASRIFALAAFGAVVSGCTGSGGGGILDRPGGNITVTDAASGRVLTTSLANPYLVGDNLLFSVNVTESDFAGPYTVNVIAHTNVATASNGGVPYGYIFNSPCFTIAENAPITTQAVTLTFSGTNANGNPIAYPTNGQPASGAATSATGNPCHSGDLETAQISDSDGHAVNFYYEIYP